MTDYSYHILFPAETEGASDSTSQPSSDECSIESDLVISKKTIGSGTYSSVFKGKLACAVKILHPHALQLFTSLKTTVQQEALKRFLEECKILECFRHPNVVRHLSSHIDDRRML